MVLNILIDKDTEKQLALEELPKKVEGCSSMPGKSLESYLSHDQFSYLQNETVKFINANKTTHKSSKIETNIHTLEAEDGVLYLQQGEMGITCPENVSISYIGSSDATTCHLLFIRDSVTGVCGLTHMSNVNKVCLNHFISKIRRVSLEKNVTLANDPASQSKKESIPSEMSNCHVKPLEVFVVGGYQDELDLSNDISIALLQYLIQSSEIFLMNILAVGRLNTTYIQSSPSEESYAVPILYGAALNIASGQVFPASFSYRGPDETVRHLRAFLKDNCYLDDTYFEPYSYITGDIVIPPFSCDLEQFGDLMQYMQLSDEKFLECTSTSPKVEPRHFVGNMKKMFRRLIENPDLSIDVFPGGCSRVWKLHKEVGAWVMNRDDQNKAIIDKEDINIMDETLISSSTMYV